ncbi:unnamed protein product [Rotaria sp. Silwood2]|nr:unnamed protein product [Rotaria sp. Silwood2]CAF4181284.1 unnamed protein product [Rotaria sp. Silwood2]CAF4345301.1 unnamed protein product [Rotaria sp. Silwood2]CAF4518198.1 unnamed protein product [Rotaria sp. Silwood2]
MSDQASSTDTTGSTELKAGHPPATKVGGMRVGAPRPRHASHGEEKNAADEDTEGVQETSDDNAAATSGNNETAAEDVNNEEATSAVAHRTAGELVSGVFVPIEKAYTTEAVKNIHDKPGTHPKNEIHTHAKYNDQKFINQPRKQ